MRAMSKAGALVLGLAAIVAFAAPAAAMQFSSAQVSGSFIYEGGKPADNRQLHFQNRASGDMFVAATNEKGEFSAHLPPGIYDLRAERGLILKKKIVVASNDFSIGQVVEPPPLDVRRPFERQGLAEAIVQTPAPATSNMKGRPLAGLQHGHTLMQIIYGPAKPLPPIPEPEPALPPETQSSPAAAPSTGMSK
jgi:hypothetical protein